MTAELFDYRLRIARRDRAVRAGPELFLHERTFDEILHRISAVRRTFRRALLIGCPDARWPRRLESVAERVDAVDPGPLFAQAAGGQCVLEEAMALPDRAFDLCVAVGTLDTVNDLPGALRLIGAALGPDSLLIGAVPGGDTLPRLRLAMRAADERTGVASPHVHPRLEPSAMAALLTGCGFDMPVIDVDRVDVRYSSLADLVRDLRAMAAANILTARSRVPLSRAAALAASDCFAAAAAAEDGKTTERFELLHFAAWTPREPEPRPQA